MAQETFSCSLCYTVVQQNTCMYKIDISATMSITGSGNDGLHCHTIQNWAVDSSTQVITWSREPLFVALTPMHKHFNRDIRDECVWYTNLLCCENIRLVIFYWWSMNEHLNICVWLYSCRRLCMSVRFTVKRPRVTGCGMAESSSSVTFSVNKTTAQWKKGTSMT